MGETSATVHLEGRKEVQTPARSIIESVPSLAMMLRKGISDPDATFLLERGGERKFIVVEVEHAGQTKKVMRIRQDNSKEGYNSEESYRLHEWVADAFGREMEMRGLKTRVVSGGVISMMSPNLILMAGGNGFGKGHYDLPEWDETVEILIDGLKGKYQGYKIHCSEFLSQGYVLTANISGTKDILGFKDRRRERLWRKRKLRELRRS